MSQSKQQKLTEFEENIAKKIKLLKEGIRKLPAYERRKKDEKNKENLHTISVLIFLGGVIFFSAGWLAVAAAPTLLTLGIVESGLFLSIAICFSARPL